jgi:hypothetical protein
MSHGAIAMEDKMPEQNGKTPVKKKDKKMRIPALGQIHQNRQDHGVHLDTSHLSLVP